MSGRRLILAALAAASLSIGLPIAGQAQSASDQAPAGQAAGDPPSRVGRLAQASGTVSFHSSDESQWQPATLNYPVTSGNSFWTEPNAHAAVDVGPSRIYMDSSTELDIGTLNDQGFVASLPQGSVFLRISDAAGATPYEIDTPRGQVHITQPGHYEVVAGNADNPTVVTSFDGGAQVTGQNINLAIGPQQAAAISGSGTDQDPFQSATGAAQQPDEFAQYVQGAEQPYQAAQEQPQQEQPQQVQPQVASGGQLPPPAVSPGMTGVEDLNQYGSWQSTPDYGQVWYPQVNPGWAPYRYGHWAYVAPWGWTWIDDAPWGFAPFHYGRWVWYGGAWAWAPGAYQPYPVYAPALVSFFGDFGGVGIGVSYGDVGWVPLGWGEPYYPSYGVSYNCFSSLNIAFVSVNYVNYNHYHDYYYGGHHHDNNYGYDHWHNYQHGATMVSADTMRHSRPVGDAWKHSPQGGWNQQWAHAKSWDGQAPVKPTFNTAGMSPRTAQKLGLNASAGNFPQHRSPGPSIAANQFRNGHYNLPNGFAANTGHGNTGQGNTGQPQTASQFFANNHGNTATARGLIPPTNGGQNHGQPLGQTFANGHGNQPLFATGQNGMGGQNGARGNTLVGHYMKTPPLFGTNGNGTNRSFASTGGNNGAGFFNNGQQGSRNWQNGTNQARNYFQQPGQTGNGTRNWQNGTNLARNYFQQPVQTGNGTRNWQNGTNQARNYFQQPAQTGNGTRNWQNGTSQTRSLFQQPIQTNNGTRNWQNGTNQARNYFQQPAQTGNGARTWQNGTNQARNVFQQPLQANNRTRNWQNGTNQARNVFQQPAQTNFGTRNWQGGGQMPVFQQPRQNFSQGGNFFQPQRNVVSNNGQGWGGGNFNRQQVQQPQRSNQGQAPTIIKKKFNN